MRLRQLALTAIAGLGLLAFAASVPAKKPKPQLCPEGSFLVTSGSLVGGSPQIITISDAHLSVGEVCPAVSVRRKARKKFTSVTGTWRGCGSALAGQVRLQAKILAPDCSIMKGFFRARKAKVNKRFEAHREPAVITGPCEPIVPGQPIANTYQLLGVTGPKVCVPNSSSNPLKPCNSDADCGGQQGTCLQTPWVSADGFAFQFPTGIKTVFTVATADSPPTCSHAACISCGNPNAACAGIPGCGAPPGPPQNPCSKNTCCDTPGFTVPTFNIPILGGLCGRVDQVACGLGVVNTSHPQTGDNEVIKEGDTSDPGADCRYGTTDDCPSPTCKACNATPTGQGGDTKGKVVRTLGNGSADVSGIHFRLPTPMLATVWQDTAKPCPDGSTFDAGETLLSQLVLNAEPSSAGATGSFADLNGDGCTHRGAGFSTASPDGPITVGPPVAQPQSYDGSVGGVEVAAGPVFSGGMLSDLGFVAILPSSPATLAPVETCTCVPVAGCPE